MESNVQKIRGALEAWLKAYDDFVAKPRNGKWPQSPCGTLVIPPINAARLVEMTKEAISIPLLNCDVGTADEQSRRFDKFCNIHDCRSDCPLFKADSCELSWSQLPYEEGGAE